MAGVLPAMAAQNVAVLLPRVSTNKEGASSCSSNSSAMLNLWPDFLGCERHLREPIDVPGFVRWRSAAGLNVGFSCQAPISRVLSPQKVPAHVASCAMKGTRALHAPTSSKTKQFEVPFERGHMRLPLQNRADDVSLNNPLLRLERMGCGWVGVLLEWEGVIVEDDAELERNAWRGLAEQEGMKLPPLYILKRAQGMKGEQAVSEVLCWSRNPVHIKRLAQRKEELYEEMQGSTYRIRPGSWEFVDALKRYNIPLAVASTRPRKYVERAIEAVGMEGFFNVIVAAEDVHRGKPDPEMFVYAAGQLKLIHERVIVVGSSNSSIEAAHDAFMKCVAVAGKHPIYELSAAELAVNRLDELSIVDLKNLADLESSEFQSPGTELEPELEVEPESLPSTKVSFQDY